MYETGLLFALITWLLGAVFSLVSINSQMEKNLKKIGMRRSWVFGSIKPRTSDDANRGFFMSLLRFSLIWGFNLAFVFASWLYVALGLGGVCYKLMKDFGAPQSVREFRWKLRNMDMTFEQVASEFYKSTEPNPLPFEEYKDDILRDMRERGIA